MPMYEFGSTSWISTITLDTFLIAQKPHWNTNYLESTNYEDIYLENQLKNKRLPNPVVCQEALTKCYADEKIRRSKYKSYHLSS